MEWNVDDRLELSHETMREVGYRVIDIVAENFATLADRKVSVTRARAELERILREPPPAAPRDPEAVLRTTRDVVLESMIHVDHPRNYGFVPGPSNYVGVLGDLLASGFNVFAGTWLEGSGAAQVEIVTLDWLREMCGLPEATRGLFVSGGSIANLTALTVAREEKLPDGPAGGVWYASSQTHSSVKRALHVLGFREHQCRLVATDEQRRLSVEALETAVAEDRSAGLRPFCVVASAGTTNTGAVDPLHALRDLCDRNDLWLHADGAYGAAAVLSPRYRSRLDGIGNVDSLSLDPHKWLFQPYGLGCVLLRDGGLLEKHFRVLPEYLQDVVPGEEEVNFCDAGVELTRGFRALKLWLTIQMFGLDNLRGAVERGFTLAEHAESRLSTIERVEITSPATLGIVSFRYLPERASDANAFNLELSRRVIDDGHALASSTVLEGRAVLRMCTINPRTTTGDVDSSLERIVALAEQLDADP